MSNQACTQKDIILLSSISVTFYKAGARTGAEKNRLVKFSIFSGTYSIDDLNAKVKAAVLQERQDWVPPQIRDLRLVILEDYTFVASSIFFIALDISDKHLEKTTLIKSTLNHGPYKISLDTSPHYSVNRSTK